MSAGRSSDSYPCPGPRPRPRPRDLGLRLGELPPGPLNAITDVPGVMVGHVTLVRGDRVRTGVTAVRPHPGDPFRRPVRAGHFVFNGYGKTTGLVQLAELGVLETPILLTNTLSVWTAANALVTSALASNPDLGLTAGTVNPVAGECADSYLNDLRGRHVTEEDCLEALRRAAGGPVPEGNEGAGTGMSCLGFKGGVGTASRLVSIEPETEIVGALVVSNFGRLAEFRLDGVPVGRELKAAGWGRPGERPATAEEAAGQNGTADETLRGGRDAAAADEPPGGSIMIIIATTAPLSSRRLTRLARRAALGLARTGSIGAHGSGDFAVAFSTVDPGEPARPVDGVLAGRFAPENEARFGPLLQAAVEATEEAIINSLFAARTMTGRDGHVRRELPVDEVMAILRRHGR